MFLTRMHSSGMRTARLLTVSEHALGRGVSAQGVCVPRGCLPGDVWQTQPQDQRQTPPVERQTPVKT